ncbi:hypothetical protein [Lewinella sp. 4G2]|uniref:hypothetical protein n=1 Tax=Lewinella sp. 4G2 TaxID=1803372 RepID=UPI0007B4C316|nr:hypothetical protein [Lewinella sp. 4G2]OAV44549.1 hypothetical protein A3850_008620 [Lewinella sp. 4G2]
MNYTASVIKKHLLNFGLIVLVLSLLFGIGVGGDDFIYSVGLAALAVGAVYGCGLIISGLVFAMADTPTKMAKPEAETASVVDAPETDRLVSSGERAKAHLLTGLLILLIGGSLCFGSLTVGPGINIH